MAIYRTIDGVVEKHCTGCDDYYPATKEFFYGTKKNKVKRNGLPFLETLCKACYCERYNRSQTRSNDVAYRYIGGV